MIKNLVSALCLLIAALLLNAWASSTHAQSFNVETQELLDRIEDGDADSVVRFLDFIEDPWFRSPAAQSFLNEAS
ncbi:MAG: hypothetical protein AAFO72_07605, partial [Pseudomonadota bacterium]